MCSHARRSFLPLFLAVMGFLGTSEPGAKTHRYIPKKQDLRYNFATAEPVLHLKPGDRLETWTESALGDHLQRPGDSLPPDFRPNPNTGPFHIDGAEPGDTLVVKLIRVEPANDFAVAITGPGSAPSPSIAACRSGIFGL